MLRIDILLSQHDNIPAPFITALQQEVEKQVSPLFENNLVRVRLSSSKDILISGCSRDEKEQILAIIENIFLSDDWLPESIS